MRRLVRAFSIDIETCPEKWGGKLRVNAGTESPDAIATILENIRARDAVEPSLPRGPPLRTYHPEIRNEDRLFQKTDA